MEKYTGHKSLELSRDKGKNLSDWMYEQFKNKIQGNILEIGSGLGIYSEKLVNDFPSSKIILSDISQEYVNSLKQQFPKTEAILLDLNNDAHFKQVGKEKFDTVIGLNVIEHVENDEKALNFIYDSLRKDGKALILVPSHPFLYNNMDKKLGHYRRYTKKSLQELVSKTKFKMDDIFFFNALGIFGWYLAGNVLKKEDVDDGAYSLYNSLIPLLKPLEKHILSRSIGISLITVLSK